jgi:predicted dehydrogenase
MAIVGPGFVAAHHLDAVRRLGDVETVGLAGSTPDGARRKAQELGVGRAYDSYAELVADPAVDVVHVATPNHLHFEVSMAALRAGKHVVSEKPLALDAAQGRELLAAAVAARRAHSVTFNYRGNPLVQQARLMIARAALGPLTFVRGHYLQDWLNDEHVYSWRVDPLRGGKSSALADIGSHWCDLAEHVSGARVIAVLADLKTVVATRYSSGASAEAFAAGGAANREPVAVTSEDQANVLLRFDNGAQGCFSVSQVLPGHANDLEIELGGRSGSLIWRQERQNELLLGRPAQPLTVLTKDPAQLDGDARRYARLPAGHQEAWSDAFRNVIADAYRWIRLGGAPADKPAALASFADGLRSLCLIDAMLASHAAGGTWQSTVFD